MQPEPEPAQAPAASAEQGAAAPVGDEASRARAMMLSQMLQQRPDMMEAIIGQIAQQNPQLLEQLGQNREAITQLLQNPEMYVVVVMIRSCVLIVRLQAGSVVGWCRWYA